jgi:Enoyl-(Acyl carrier protein) reductase
VGLWGPDEPAIPGAFPSNFKSKVQNARCTSPSFSVAINGQGIITGAASGIGAACAKMLKEKSADWKLVLGDLNVKGGEAVAASLGKDVIFEKCDASNYDDIAKLFAIAKEKFGRVDFGTQLARA